MKVKASFSKGLKRFQSFTICSNEAEETTTLFNCFGLDDRNSFIVQKP